MNRSHHVEQQRPPRPARHLEQRSGHRARPQRHDTGDPSRAKIGEHYRHEGSGGRVSKDRTEAMRRVRRGQRRLLELRDTVQHEGGKSSDRHGEDGTQLRSYGGRLSPAQGARDQRTESGRRLRSAAGTYSFSSSLDDFG